MLAQTIEPLPPVTSTELELHSIRQRLAQQEAELSQLRSQLGTIDPTRSAASPLANDTTTEPVSFAEYTSIAPSTASAEPAPYEIGSDKKLNANWNHGLEFKSEHGDFRMHVGGALNYDLVSFADDEPLEIAPALGGIGPNPDSTQIRRARVVMDGKFYEVIDFKMEYEFANFLSPASPTAVQPVVSSPAFTDMWLQWTHLPILGNVRVGSQKEPLGMEHLMSFKFTDFMERSYLQDIAFGPYNNGFAPGISALDLSEDGRWTWAAGIFGNNSDPFGYSIGDDWAITGRTTYLLYYDEPSEGRYLWEAGISGSVRKPDEGLVRLRTRGNIRSGPPGVLNPIFADTGNMEAERENILSFETAYQAGPWSIEAEYAGILATDVVQPFTPQAARVDRGDPLFHGGYVQAMYFLTGEHRSYSKPLAALDRVIPNENFFRVQSGAGICQGSGAWQLGLRYSGMDLNDNGINGGILHSGTLGLNWFLNPNAKVQFNYDLTHRSAVGQALAGYINGFGTRIAFDF
ncbi:MAG: porin [Planctomycetota bacterium]|nr:porin [Planctomycetota bacterium]